jgi:biopolymer transport protein ExbD/biopolymer transport protein TolR
MKAEINVTPLVDIVLVLLIIFIVITPAVPHAVRLPVARHGRVPAQAPGAVDLTLVLLPRGGSAQGLADPGLVRVEGALGQDAQGLPISFDLADPGGRGRLERFVRNAVAQPTDRRVFIKADLGLPFKQVDALLQICRQGGAEEASVITREEKTGRGNS